MHDLISVIIPCHNGADFLAETIESALAQTWPNKEIIVVDDGSTDGTWGVMASFGDLIQPLRQEHSNGNVARNFAVRHARGRYYHFLDADDLVDPDTLERLHEALVRQPDRVAFCPIVQLRRQDGEWAVWEPRNTTTPADGDFLRAWLTWSWYSVPAAALWPRDVFERVGGWDGRLPAFQDMELSIRALLMGVEYALTDGGKAYWRRHGKERRSITNDFHSATNFRSRVLATDTFAARMREVGRFEPYKLDLARFYYWLGDAHGDADDALFAHCMDRARELGGWRCAMGRWPGRLAYWALGHKGKLRLKRAVAKAISLART